jgi:hypothetical protein
MRRTIFATLATLAAAFLANGFMIALASQGAQPQKKNVAEAQPTGDAKKPKLLYYGVSLCANCHQKTETKDGKKVPAAIPEEEAVLYRGTEMHVWNDFDKHKKATLNLLEPGSRGQQIVKILGYKDGVLDRRCINCHGVYIDKDTPLHPSLESEQKRKDSGVSCVVCHGPYEDWVDEHAKPTAIGNYKTGWNTYTAETKKKRWGMNNLWDPVVRAELCSSCHIGSVKENKVVTHEMYAAGHPPLPGFEIQTFSEFMPQHWENLNVKIKRADALAKREKEPMPELENFFQKIGYYDPAQGDMEQTRMLVTSALVAFRESVRLLHDAAEDSLNKGGKVEWPEFALYDCYACHHDLKSDSWRQKRGYLGTPGRPQMRPWSEALIPLAIQHTGVTGKQSDFDGQLKTLEQILSKAPFGKEQDVCDATKKMIDWSNELLAEVKKAPFNKENSRKLLAGLVDRKPKEYLDWDSARMVGWGLRTMLPELGDAAALKRKEMTALEDSLKLDFVKGQKEIVGDYLSAYLQALSDYDPNQFKKTLIGLQDLADGAPKKKTK